MDERTGRPGTARRATRDDVAAPPKHTRSWPVGVRRRCAVGAIFLCCVAAGAALAGSWSRRSITVCSEPATRILCAQHLRQIGQALAIYHSKHGVCPPSFEELLLHTDLGPLAFVCPHTPHTPAAGMTPAERADDFRRPGHNSYVFAGAGLSAKDLTPARVLAYEPLSNNRGDGINVLFGDVRVEWLSRPDALQLLAELEAGHNPPRVPGAAVAGSGSATTAPSAGSDKP